MAGYQYTIIVGNVGRDPELRYTQSGVAVASFSVAVTERWNDRQSNERREKTIWFKVSAWRQLAEMVNQYVHKGMQIMVAGTLEASAYLDKAGQPAATLELTARDIQFLGSRDDAQAGGQSSGYEPSGAPPADDLNDIPF